MPHEPVELSLELERRDIHISRDGDTIVVGPERDLTDDDCRRIQRWKPHLLALIDYEPPEVL
jgi:hypothetical protein